MVLVYGSRPTNCSFVLGFLLGFYFGTMAACFPTHAFSSRYIDVPRALAYFYISWPVLGGVRFSKGRLGRRGPGMFRHWEIQRFRWRRIDIGRDNCLVYSTVINKFFLLLTVYSMDSFRINLIAPPCATSIFPPIPRFGEFFWTCGTESPQSIL